MPVQATVGEKTVINASKRRASKSPNRLALDRFIKNKLAVISVFLLLIIVFISIGAPLFTHWNPTIMDMYNTDSAPTAAHLLGTDVQGFDYLARDLYGGRADLLVGFLDTIMIMGIGIVLGGLAGYYGRWVDAAIMRFCDFMLNFPFILLIIVLRAVFGTTSLWVLIVVIAATGWPSVTRLVRGMFLNLRESEYVLAARISGSSAWRIIFKHMLPNSLGPLVVNATLLMAGMVSLEAGLSLIGFGVTPPQPSWGNVLSGALTDFLTLQSEPWSWIPPAIMITLTVLCINFIGDGLRDAFDPSFEK